MEWINKWGGRKFVFASVLSIIFFGFFIGGMITADELKGFLEWIFGLFVVGNVIQKFSDK